MEQQSVKKYYAHIWLDDFRIPDIPSGENVFWVMDYDKFVSCVIGLGERISDCIVHFDHDLGEGKNGYDCAKWLVNWCIDNGYKAPSYEIRSANPVGAENIKSIFESYYKIYGK